ncbi:hypothetical protein niasHS_015217 [Heterodera schachtii]
MNANSAPMNRHELGFSSKFHIGRNSRELANSMDQANGGNANGNAEDDDHLDYEWIFNPIIPSLDFIFDSDRKPSKGMGGGGEHSADHNKSDQQHSSAERMCERMLREINQWEEFADQMIIDPPNDNSSSPLWSSSTNETNEHSSQNDFEKHSESQENDQIEKNNNGIFGSEKIRKNGKKKETIRWVAHLTKNWLDSTNSLKNVQNLLVIIYLSIELTVSQIPIIGRAIGEQKTLSNCLMSPTVMAHFALSLLTIPPFYTKFGPVLKAQKKPGKYLTAVKFVEEIFKIILKNEGEIGEMDEKLRNLQFYSLFYEFLSAFFKGNKKTIADFPSEKHLKSWERAKQFVQIYEQMFKNQLEKIETIGLGETMAELGKIKRGDKVIDEGPK